MCGHVGNRGAYIVLEGIDGAGTTTHSRLLAKNLERLGYCTCLFEEPSKGDVGIVIRKILSQGPFDQRLLSLLFAADRLMLRNSIEECLDRGCIAISDRSWVSSLAYQSYDGFPGSASPEWVYVVNRYAMRPDILIFLDVDPVIAYCRLGKRRGSRELPERLQALRGLARRYEYVLELVKGIIPLVVRVKGSINGRERPVESVSRDILTVVLAALRYWEYNET
ncbi:Thymidylate kinase [Pyrodictium delaneyi]|uniref:Probable thymidylate kinase n=1 Tax=Pyrodictium delaneyi TaxID=1273541 RepID=A0A0P0N111_9CREN|nr:dTMP kinase [Pyrodictium delaneyi]ALL00213.1 Thymidylate kinase [Pyrodictium delaneyi]OWJ54297.1 dTMP kinase [Pyrodictium delaneyi]